MARRTITIVLLLAILMLGGCGRKAKEKPIETTTSTAVTLVPTSPTVTMPKTQWPPTPAATVSSTDATNALAANLQIVDLPADWKELLPARTTTANDDINDRVVQCYFGETPSPLTAYTVSALYGSPDNATVARSFVRTTVDQRAASTDFSKVTPARIGACEVGSYALQQELPKTGLKGKRWGTAAPATPKVDPLKAPGDRNDVAGFRALLLPSDAPQTYLDVYMHGFGRYEAVLLIQSANGYAGEGIASNMIEGIRSRVDAAARK